MSKQEHVLHMFGVVHQTTSEGFDFLVWPSELLKFEDLSK